MFSVNSMQVKFNLLSFFSYEKPTGALSYINYYFCDLNFGFLLSFSFFFFLFVKITCSCSLYCSYLQIL